MKLITLLGSTGSIGTSTLEVVAQHPQRFRLEVLAAHRNAPLLLRQAKQFKPKVIAVADPIAAQAVIRAVRSWKKAPKVFVGPEGIEQAAAWPASQMVVSAIVGKAGLQPTLAAIRAGKDIALANKETLVMAGDLVMAEVKRHRVKLLPVDSEHAALAQCLAGHSQVPVRRLLLTASGGPFVRASLAAMRRVTVAQALRHPTWAMGQKITIDSATMMNKGLEVIEAHHLFQVPYVQIEVVIHTQSIIHSMVEFVDGSVLAQMANPDMRLPIQAALTAPEKVAGLVQPLDFSKGLCLTFAPPDFKRFPALQLAYTAGQARGTAPAVLNAANEVAVAAFLNQRLDFLGIPRVIGRVLAQHDNHGRHDLKSILQADAWARHMAEEEIACKR